MEEAPTPDALNMTEALNMTDPGLAKVHEMSKNVHAFMGALYPGVAYTGWYGGRLLQAWVWQGSLLQAFKPWACRTVIIMPGGCPALPCLCASSGLPHTVPPFEAVFP